MGAFALLVAIALAHLAPDVLASLTGVAAAVWFYPLRGVLGVALLVGLVWFPRPVERRTLAVIAWGAYEETLTIACGGADVVNRVTPAPFTGLCDAHTSMPWYSLSLVICIALVVWLAFSADSRKVKV